MVKEKGKAGQSLSNRQVLLVYLGNWFLAHIKEDSKDSDDSKKSKLSRNVFSGHSPGHSPSILGCFWHSSPRYLP